MSAPGQVEILRVLFDLDAEVLRALADTLLEKRIFTRDELIPFLSRVRLPQEFPLPFGPLDRFSTSR